MTDVPDNPVLCGLGFWWPISSQWATVFHRGWGGVIIPCSWPYQAFGSTPSPLDLSASLSSMCPYLALYPVLYV